jgi:XTP/dITP diphosphohydrolase
LKLCFATHNAHKLLEIRELLGNAVELHGLTEIGCHEEIPETGDSLRDNALIKAQYVAGYYHIDCFADDTGLEVDALNGAPGIFSARYAGEPPNNERNINLLLANLKDISSRKAHFKTVIALIIQGDIHYFEGIVEGRILDGRKGDHGFGYDAVFLPDGSNQTFAEMTLSEKNRTSHRAKAVKKLVAFLHNKITN